MDEENPRKSDTNILHIFPASNEPTNTIKEYYSPGNVEVNSKHRFKLKFNVERIIKAGKKRLTTVTRKHPRATREHTDFDQYPYTMTCPNCLNYIITDIYHCNNVVTHAIAASLAPICLCMIPYCSHEFKDTAHYCPDCKIYLGTKFGPGRSVSRHFD